MDADELRGYREAAQREGLRLSEWVRLRLREAKRDGPAKKAEQKLRAIRVAASYSFPTGDIDQMLAEIEAGRTAE
jgi:hypothetical protein